MKNCTVCKRPGKFVDGINFFCHDHASLTPHTQELIKEGHHGFKKFSASALGFKRLKKLKNLEQEINAKTSELLKTINHLHSDAIFKVQQEYFNTLALMSSHDQKESLDHLSQKFVCGLIIDNIDLNSIKSFYNQEFFKLQTQDKIQYLSQEAKENIIFTKYSLIIEDYEPPVSLLSLSSSGNKLALIDGKNYLQVFETQEKNHLVKAKLAFNVSLLKFNSDEKSLWLVSDLAQIFNFELEKSKLNQINVPSAPVLAVICDEFNLYWSNKESKLMKFGFESLQVEVLIEDKPELCCLDVLFTKDKLLLGSSSGEVLVFDMNDRQSLLLVKAQVCVAALACGKNCDLVVVALASKHVDIWSVGQGKKVGTLAGHFDSVTLVKFTPGDTYIVTGCNDKKIRIFEGQSFKNITYIQPSNLKVSCLSVSDDNRWMHIAAGDLKICSLLDRKVTDCQLSRGHSTTVSCIIFSKLHSKAFTGSKDKSIKIWKLHKQKLVSTLLGHTDEIIDMVLSANEQILISSSSDKSIRSWDLIENKQINLFQSTNSKSTKLWIDSKSEILVAQLEDKSIRVYLVSTGKIIHTFNCNSVISAGFLILKSGLYIVVASEDKQIKLLNIIEKKIEKPSLSHTTPIISIGQGPNSYISCSVDGQVHIYSNETFAVLDSFSIPPSVQQAILTSDGKYLGCRYQNNYKLICMERKIVINSVETLASSNWFKFYIEFNKLGK